MIVCNAIPDGVLAWRGRRRVGLIHSRWEQRRRARPHETCGGRRQRGTRLLLHTDLQFCSLLHQNLAPKLQDSATILFFGHLTPTLPKQVYLPYTATMKFKELQTAEAPAKHRLQCRHCRGIISVRARAIAHDSCAASSKPWMNGETLTHPEYRACEGFCKKCTHQRPRKPEFLKPRLRATSHTRLRARNHLHFKHSHWWKRQSRSNFASHYAWGTNGVFEGKMDSYMASKWITFHGHLDCFQKKSPLGGRLNTRSRDHDTLNVHNHWFILFYHAWRPVWIEIHWNSIWLRTRSHMTSHYTWRSVATLWFWRCLGTAFGHFLLGSHNSMVTALGSCVWSGFWRFLQTKVLQQLCSGFSSTLHE